ncbi:MAG: hypothetical protein WCL34_13125 [Methylococcaceae bacterium]
MTTQKLIDDVLNDPTISHWLKSALSGALNRDPLDATNDAEMLFFILSRRLGELFANYQPPELQNDSCVPL